jgi:hypothetical protein
MTIAAGRRCNAFENADIRLRFAAWSEFGEQYWGGVEHGATILGSVRAETLRKRSGRARRHRQASGARLQPHDQRRENYPISMRGATYCLVIS